ncbi:MAG: DUF4956 domain-containing protein [Bacteroidetes bacterium]|jgi:hypothetical protein|nr:DUF4956 domain-containing protein [Bacteroidota bacterium]MBT6687659.1 DUF4956 domain-containing protein [Bacteroidota bacterium]MBT7142854.1 DUF4956 domain-containing protein [Bacteroidota bacterium]MBT7492586.1 DUF4956 domain-containing protein [Bacteroidota bacterium]
MENKWSLFQKFLITQDVQISIQDFVLNSVVIIILSIILELTYAKCAKSLSNRKIFAANFILIAFTTMLIISIVKSSLALSLGLVGALSIVRFRSAIKEPEELAYLFLTISIGLGLGANQVIITIIAFTIVTLIIWARFFINRKSENQNLFFTISSNSPTSIELNTIVEIVKNNFKAAELKRYDKSEDLIEAAFMVEIKKTGNIQDCTKQLEDINKSIRISYIDN